MRRVHAGPLEALAHRLAPRQTHTEVREGRDKDATRGKGAGRRRTPAGRLPPSGARRVRRGGEGVGNYCIESKSRAGGTAVDCRPLVRPPDVLIGLAICASIAQVPVQSGTGGEGTVGSLVECVSKAHGHHKKKAAISMKVSRCRRGGWFYQVCRCEPGNIESSSLRRTRPRQVRFKSVYLA